MLAGKQTYVKETKNTSRKVNLFAGKQKYLKHSKNIWREAKTFSQESKEIVEGKQKILMEIWHFSAIIQFCFRFSEKKYKKI